MTWEEFQLFMKGKIFLIGLTFIDQNEHLIELYQTSGIVEELDDSGILKFRRLDGSLFMLPYAQETISVAVAGKYSEKGTGNIVVNPDYITTWIININDGDDFEEVKLNGYVPQSPSCT